MPTFFCIILLTILCCFPFNSLAQELTAGEYITEGGWGNLVISNNATGGLSFEIIAVGANGHTCSLDGEINGGQSVLEGIEDDQPCVVTLTPTEQGIQVTDNDGGCSHYCGARAGFVDLYKTPEAGCDPASVEKARHDFKQFYDKKEFARAREKLEPVLSNCSNMILWPDLGWIRNDLAITLYKLHDYAGCLKVLQPLEEDAERSEEELREAYPPADAETAIPIAEAAETNLELCSSEEPR